MLFLLPCLLPILIYFIIYPTTIVSYLFIYHVILYFKNCFILYFSNIIKRAKTYIYLFLYWHIFLNFSVCPLWSSSFPYLFFFLHKSLNIFLCTYFQLLTSPSNLKARELNMYFFIFLCFLVHAISTKPLFYLSSHWPS